MVVVVCFVRFVLFWPDLFCFFIRFVLIRCASSSVRGVEGGDDQGEGGIQRVRAQGHQALREHEAPQGAGQLSSDPYRQRRHVFCLHLVGSGNSAKRLQFPRHANVVFSFSV